MAAKVTRALPRVRAAARAGLCNPHHPFQVMPRRAAGGTLALMRFQLKQKLLSIGDDFWIEDEDGQKVFKVDGKAMRLRDTFVLEDREGHELAKIKEKKLSLRDTMKVERGGHTVATVHKRKLGIRDRFHVDVEDGEDLDAKGNFVDHEYEIKRDGDVIATVSKKWFRMRDTYGIDVRDGEDAPLILALTVAIDDLSHDRGG